MKRNFKRLTAPAHWASAIVNRDYSGLEPSEIGQVNTFLAREGVSFTDAAGCEDGPFMHHHDARQETGTAAECKVYFFPMESN